VTAEEVTESESRQHMFEPFRRTKTRRRVARPLLSREEMNNWDSNYGILVPHGAGPTKIVAPRIDQKRVGRVNNHFHAYRNTVGAGGSIVLVQGLLNRHRLMTRTQMPRRSEKPRAAKTDSPSDFVFTEPQVLKGKGVEASKPSVTVVEEPQPSPAPVQVVKVDEPVPTAPPATATPSKTKKSSKAKPTSKNATVKVEPLHHVPSGELMPSFRAWVESLSWREVPLTVFRVREGGHDRVSKILFERLPGAMRHEHLAHWKQRNWVRVHGGKLGIVNTGCVVLCPRQLDAFMASPQAQVVEIGEGSERVVVKPRAETASPAPANTTTQKPGIARINSAEELPYLELKPEQQGVFMDWFGKNRYRFYGDFYYQKAADGDKSTVAGTYEEGIYTLSEAVIKECLGEVPKGFLNYYRNSGAGGQKMLDIPCSLAHKLLPLRKWIDAHAADIVGHPQHKPNGTSDVASDGTASYTPTLIGINKDNVKEVLPEVTLPKLRVYRPDIAKKRPRLIKIRVPDSPTLTASSS
jgi:hypothetical protein